MFNVKINRNSKVKLYSLTIEQYQYFFSNIIKILENNNIFYSITKEQSNNTISLFIEECDELKEMDNIKRENNTYNIFSIYTYDNQINNCGIVHNISNVFTKYNIPIIYINTFYENLILVNENDFDKAVLGLQLLVNEDDIFIY
jgi:hypothetical protein